MKIRLNAVVDWHEYLPGVRFHLAPVGTREIRKTYKASDGDDEKFEELLTDKVLLGWEGVQGSNGLDLPVTLENKLAIRNNPALSAWIDEKTKGLTVVDEAEIKN